MIRVSRWALGGRLAFGPNKSLGENWEGEAPAEPTVQRFGRSLTLPLKLQAIPKRKRDGLLAPVFVNASRWFENRG